MGKMKPEENILDSIITPELKDLTKEVLELSIDDLANNDAVKQIPIINFLLAGYKTVIAYREYQYIKKISYFLFEQTKVNKKEREEWLAKLEKKKEKMKLGEVTLELIDKVTTVEKAIMLGVIFRHQIQGEIKTQDFLRIAEMIQAAYLDDIY